MNKRIKIIAEVGPNHQGSFTLAKKIISKLAKIDCDFIKFQLANPEKVYSADAFKANYQKKNDKEKSIIKMSKKNQLSKESHLHLAKICKKFDKRYACTAFELNTLKFLVKKIKIPFIKIASGEITSIDLLEYISKQNLPIILSTGMSTIKEIKNCISILNKYKKKNITIMHCVSSYPAKPEQINLKFIKELKKTFNCNVGYSDHSMTDEACIAAVAMGANTIEKHITTDRSLSGPDHKASYTIEEFKALVFKIRNLEKILGHSKKIFHPDEVENRKMARKSIVAKTKIKKGQKIYLKNISFKRPGTGISPMKYKSILGKKAKTNLSQNTLIKRKDLKL